MTKATPIHRRPDGSIDTDFYIARGRMHRSATARDTAKGATRKSGKALMILAALGLATVFRGGQV